MLEVATLQDDALRRTGTDDEVVGSVGEGRGRSQGERGLAATGEKKRMSSNDLKNDIFKSGLAVCMPNSSDAQDAAVPEPFGRRPAQRSHVIIRPVLVRSQRIGRSEVPKCRRLHRQSDKHMLLGESSLTSLTIRCCHDILPSPAATSSSS